MRRSASAMSHGMQEVVARARKRRKLMLAAAPVPGDLIGAVRADRGQVRLSLIPSAVVAALPRLRACRWPWAPVHHGSFPSPPSGTHAGIHPHPPTHKRTHARMHTHKIHAHMHTRAHAHTRTRTHAHKVQAIGCNLCPMHASVPWEPVSRWANTLYWAVLLNRFARLQAGRLVMISLPQQAANQRDGYWSLPRMMGPIVICQATHNFCESHGLALKRSAGTGS